MEAGSSGHANFRSRLFSGADEKEHLYGRNWAEKGLHLSGAFQLRESSIRL